ncbi:MAG: hypothetical protein D6734_03315 [Candidatus Schekmanbacteria bacterium]|nr:MAG: hypothetical protein D6734_03315 [Candidatus Schekmanbacteria bacterium]
MKMNIAIKRMMMVILLSFAVLTIVPNAYSGIMLDTYHNGDTLICTDCHIMHASMQHNYAGDTSAEGNISSFPYNGTPNEKLLKASGINLCVSCHDGKAGIPDVVGADVNGLTERAAGKFDTIGVLNYKGHNLKNNPKSLCSRCHFYGSMATAGVECLDCHTPHGNYNYRNLARVNAPDTDVRAFIKSGVTGLQRYEQSNIGYGAPSAGDNSWREVTNVCKTCHHAFMDSSDHYNTQNNGMWIRHPGTNTEQGAYSPINAAGANTDPAHWVDGTGEGFDIPRLPFIVAGATDYTSATTVAADNNVFCLTCHKAHGSDNSFSLRWEVDTESIFSKGCRQCHNNVDN